MTQCKRHFKSVSTPSTAPKIIRTKSAQIFGKLLDKIPFLGYFLWVEIYEVVVSKSALKDLSRVSLNILDKFQSWVEAVQLQGLYQVRKLPGLHDEPLKGKRKGQRSIRLNRSYRAIYTIEHDTIEFIFVREVTNHEY